MIPPTDVRIPYAMETHGVEVSLLQSQPSEVRSLTVHSRAHRMYAETDGKGGAASVLLMA